MNNICYLNGEFVNLADAKISVLDRGFIFGEGIYEVMAAVEGNLLHFKNHFERLQDGAKDMELDIQFSETKLHNLIKEVLLLNNNPFCSVYLQFTKGAAPRDHYYPTRYDPTLFIMTSPINMPPRLNVVKAILLKDIRWQKCNVKSTSLYANTWAKTKAKKSGGEEAIFERNGILTEGATSNLFLVHKNKVLTPKENEHILPGVTRELVLEIMRRKNIDHEETNISIDSLWKADELLLTSTTKGIVAVKDINGKQIGDGETFNLGVEIFQALKTLSFT